MRTFLFTLALIIIIGFGWFLKHKALADKQKTKFTPEELIDLIQHGDNYIAGVCKEKGFLRVPNLDSLGNEKSIKYILPLNSECSNITGIDNDSCLEGIITWREFPNRLAYFIKGKEKYDLFWENISSLDLTQVSEKDYDVWNFNCKQYLVNNTVFTKDEYIPILNGWGTHVILKDKIVYASDTVKMKK